MARSIAGNLPVFQFPASLMNSVGSQACALSSASGAGDAPRAPTRFRLPFNIIAGGESENEQDPFWFVRRLRCAS